MFLLFDIGGSKLRVGITLDRRTVDDIQIMDMPKSYEQGVKLFIESAKNLAGGNKIIAGAGGIPGSLDATHSMLSRCPNLPFWVGKPFCHEIESALNTKIYFENDSAMVGLGEALHGAGKGWGIMVYLTVSTGVGGVRIVAGKVDENYSGFEPGQQIIDFKKNTTLESLISGRAIEMRYGRPPREVNDPNLWKDLARILAYGVHNSIMHWSPDVVVLGGPMITGSPAISLEDVKVNLQKISQVFHVLPKIKQAELGNIGGIHGALEYAKRLS